VHDPLGLAKAPAAMGGMRPVAEIMTINFALLAIDQIVNHAAKFHYMFAGKIRVPMVMRTVSGWGQLGATHSQTFENWFSSVPGLKVVAPATPRDAKGLLKASIEDDDPVIFIEHSLLYGIRGEVPDTDFRETLGQALVVREGADVTIVGYSRMLQVALRAAAQLEEQGVSAEVIDPRTLAPLDTATILESVAKTGRLVLVDQATRHGSASAVIAAEVADQGFDSLRAPIKQVTAFDATIPYSEPMERFVLPDEDKIVAAVHQVLGSAPVAAA